MSKEEIACSDCGTEAVVAKTKRYLTPRYEVKSSDHQHLVKVYTPGVEKSKVEVTREKDLLTITASRTPHYQESWKQLSREIPDTDYRLRLRLNVELDEDKIEATLENGILEVTLPIAKAAAPRKINIA